MHPKERPAAGPDLSRREFLKKSAGAAVAVAGGAALILPWGHAKSVQASRGGGSAGSGPTPSGPAPFQIASPEHPRTLPLFDDNPAIASGLPYAKGVTLQIYNWADYIWQRVVNNFSQHYGVKVQITTFDTSSEFLTKISTGDVAYDVAFPTPDLLGKLTAAKVLQPLNHEYLPNLSNVWPSLQDPFYDKGSRYSVPYTIYSTGIGWRNDMVKDDIPGMSNPYDIYWDSRYRGKIYLLDDYREAPAMVLLRDGYTDINTGDAAIMERVKNQLIDLISAVNIKSDVNDYTELPEGSAAIHQAWSGDMISAQYYLPKGVDVSTLSYWFPPKGNGALGSDVIGIPKNAKNPVLAHMFLNYMLDYKVAYSNMANFNGYQPPQNQIDPDHLVADGVVPKNLATAVVKPEDFDHGYLYSELPPQTQALWNSIWQQFKAGA